MHAQLYLFVAPWTVAHQAPLSMGFSSKNTGVGCHFLLHAIFLTQGSNLRLLYWQADSLPLSPPRKPLVSCHTGVKCSHSNEWDRYVNRVLFQVNVYTGQAYNVSSLLPSEMLYWQPSTSSQWARNNEIMSFFSPAFFCPFFPVSLPLPWVRE